MTTRASIWVSGTGRHLENFAELAQSGALLIEVVHVLSNKAGVKALDRAAKFGLPSEVLDAERALDAEAFSRAAFDHVEASGAEVVILAGFLRKLVIPEGWEGRVLNIHPSLLPAFGGKGYWGHHVHEGVLARGCKLSGCTVHYVNNEYDAGPILVQKAVPVEAGDDADSLAARVFEAELEAYPEALRLHLGL